MLKTLDLSIVYSKCGQEFKNYLKNKTKCRWNKDLTWWKKEIGMNWLVRSKNKR